MRKQNNASKTLSQVVNELVNLGYTTEIEYERNSLYYYKGNERCSLKPKDLVITQIYLFEGVNIPSDSAVEYAIESSQGKKGLLIDTYGSYSDEHN